MNTATKLNTVRIATVIATGKRYFVQQLDLRSTPGFAHVWGEVCKTKGRSTKHEGSKKFLLNAVVISDVHKTRELVADLFDQMIDSKREAGHVITVSRNGRNATDHGTRA